MATVLLVIHLMVAAALVGVVLLQKSEGGALGIGGGGGGGFLTGRGTANLLTRATAMLAAAFFATSISLTLLARNTQPAGSVFDGSKPAAAGAPSVPGTTVTPADATKPAEGRGGILDKLQPPGQVPGPAPGQVPGGQ
jgi:preprotein translocase subunit SecG